MDQRILDVERLSLTEAAQRLGVHVATCFRWATRGVRGRKLPTILVGGRRFVLTEDLQQWLAAANSDSASPAVRPTSAEERADAAKQELDRRGI